MTTAQTLPPKMAEQFAERARKGEASKVLGEKTAAYDSRIYVFENEPGGWEVTLMALNPPQGHYKKIKKAPKPQA